MFTLALPIVDQQTATMPAQVRGGFAGAMVSGEKSNTNTAILLIFSFSVVNKNNLQQPGVVL